MGINTIIAYMVLLKRDGAKQQEKVKMEYYGIYYVDATDIDGWQAEGLADALEKPLADIGIDVEIGQNIAGLMFFDNVGYDKQYTLREQASHIIEKVVTQ